MKKILLLLIIISINTASAAMTKQFVVTKVFYNQDKKDYQIDFKNQAGVYHLPENGLVEKNLSCLRDSLKTAKLVTVVFIPMGLEITDCAMVSTK